MCEIQFVMSRNINDEEIKNFLDMLNDGSYSNSDATGLCTDNGTKWKFRTALHRLKDLKTKNLLSDIRVNTSNFLIGHNRLATTGDEKFNKNNHPFETANIMLVHNGIISNHDSLKGDFSLKYKEDTDSAIIPHLLETYLTIPDNDIVTSIKEVAESLQGSYSVMLLHKPSGRIFYFKNSSTSFMFMKAITPTGKMSLYGSTKSDNLMKVYGWEKDGIFNVDTLKKRAFAEPESGVIYEITKKDLGVTKIDEFTPLTYIRTAYGGTTTYFNNRGTWEKDYGWGDYGGVDVNRPLIPEIPPNDLDEYNETYGNGKDAHRIENLLEDMISEISYLTTNDSLIDDFARCDIDFYDSSNSIVIKNITKDAVIEIKNYIGLRDWTTTDNPMGTQNVTMAYDDVEEFVDNFSHKHLNSGAV